MLGTAIETPTAHTSSAIVSCTITLDLIRPCKRNPRKTFDEADLRELADSIRQFGVIEPIVVRPTYRLACPGDIVTVEPDAYHEDPSRWPTMQFELVAGERRVRASRLAGLREVPAVIRRLSDRETDILRIIENLHRAEICPLEFAESLKVLRDDGMTLREIAASIGKSEAAVRGSLLLVDAAPAKLINAVKAGKVSASVAELVCRIPDERGKREKAAALVIPNGKGDAIGFREAKAILAKRFGPKGAGEKTAKKARKQAEPADRYGLTRGDLEAAYVAHKLSEVKGKEPIKIKPVEIEGALYVAIGSFYDGQGTTTSRLLPLMPVSFKPPDGPGYLGVLVQSKGQWYAIGSNNNERLLSVQIDSQKTQATAARKTKSPAKVLNDEFNDEIEVNDAPLSRNTSTVKLLDACGISGLKRALTEHHKILTVGDLLDRAEKHPHGVGLIQKVYSLLRQLTDPNPDFASKIGDYLVDAGLTNDGLASVGSDWRKLSISNLELSPRLDAYLASKKIATIGELADQLDSLAGLKSAEVENLRVLVADAMEGDMPYTGLDDEQ